MSKIKIGDRVKIVESGSCYSLYDDWAKAVKAKKWKSGNDCENGDIGILKAIRNHDYNIKKIDYSQTILVLVDIKGKEVIINLRGVSKIMNKNTTKEKASYKVGDIVFNENTNQKSKVLFVKYDEESESYNYVTQCQEDAGSLDFVNEGELRDIEVEKVTLEELIDCYKENNEVDDIKVILPKGKK